MIEIQNLESVHLIGDETHFAFYHLLLEQDIQNFDSAKQVGPAR